MTTRKVAKAKTPRKTAAPRKRKSRAKSAENGTSQALVPRERRTASRPPPSPWVHDDLKPLPGDLPSVTVKDEAEALFYFARLDERLAEAWKRDVVMHEGPITIRRSLPSSFGTTHYAYVDRRLLWYLKRDPSDPLGARWEGYLKTAGDAPRGAIAVFVGLDIMAKKTPPAIESGES